MSTEPSVRNAVETIFTTWNTHNPETFAAAFPENAEFTDIQGHTSKGQRAIAERHVKPFKILFQNAELSLADLSTKQLTDDVVSADAHWKLSGRVSPKGEPLPDGRGIMAIVLVKRGNTWQAEVVHNADYTEAYKGAKL